MFLTGWEYPQLAWSTASSVFPYANSMAFHLDPADIKAMMFYFDDVPVVYIHTPGKRQHVDMCKCLHLVRMGAPASNSEQRRSKTTER